MLAYRPEKRQGSFRRRMRAGWKGRTTLLPNVLYPVRRARLWLNIAKTRFRDIVNCICMDPSDGDDCQAVCNTSRRKTITLYKATSKNLRWSLYYPRRGSFLIINFNIKIHDELTGSTTLARVSTGKTTRIVPTANRDGLKRTFSAARGYDHRTRRVADPCAWRRPARAGRQSALDHAVVRLLSLRVRWFVRAGWSWPSWCCWPRTDRRRPARPPKPKRKPEETPPPSPPTSPVTRRMFCVF